MTALHSDSIGALAAALAKAQTELKPAIMNSTNAFLHNRYADLGAVIQAAQAVLPKNGLAVSQLVGNTGDRLAVTTILMHTSGEWIQDTASLELGDEKGKSAAQVAGSIITYLRRYGLAAIVGIYADEDQDGAGSNGNGNGHQVQTTQPTQVTTKADPPAPAQTWTKDKAILAKLNAWIGDHGLTGNEALKGLGVPRLTAFTRTYEEALAAISAYIAAKVQAA